MFKKNKVDEDTILFDIYEKDKSSEFQAVFDMIWGDLNLIGKPINTVKNIKRILRNMLSSLLDGYYKGKRVSLSRARKDFIKGARYYKLKIKFEAFDTVYKGLLAGEWIEILPHKIPGKNKRGTCTKIQASPKLQEFLKTLPMPEKKANKLVCLKKKINGKKVEVNFRSTEFTDNLENSLGEINDMYERHSFSYDSQIVNYKIINPFNKHYNYYLNQYPKKEEYGEVVINGVKQMIYHVPNELALIPRINLLFPRLRIVFANGDFEQGGRLYCSPLKGKCYQSLSQKERNTILINGLPTVELDYGCLHISMLYARNGIQIDKYAYDITGLHEDMKPIIKSLMLTVINTENDTKAIQAMNGDVTKLKYKKIIKEREFQFLLAHEHFRPDWQYLINKLREEHHPIRIYFCSGAGNYLQKQDSTIIQGTLKYFTDINVPCLPVHDSIIITQEHKHELKEIMKASYLEQMKKDCYGVDEK